MQNTTFSLIFFLIVVDQGLYTVHSYDIPYQQENGTLNFCWQSHNGELALWQFCQVFKIHIPGLYKRAAKKERTVSFESVCLPGFFVRQKNYHLIVQRRDGTELFGELSIQLTIELTIDNHWKPRAHFQQHMSSFIWYYTLLRHKRSNVVIEVFENLVFCLCIKKL